MSAPVPPFEVHRSIGASEEQIQVTQKIANRVFQVSHQAALNVAQKESKAGDHRAALSIAREFFYYFVNCLGRRIVLRTGVTSDSTRLVLMLMDFGDYYLELLAQMTLDAIDLEGVLAPSVRQEADTQYYESPAETQNEVLFERIRCLTGDDRSGSVAGLVRHILRQTASTDQTEEGIETIDLGQIVTELTAAEGGAPIEND